jgi:hypothetical protein
LGSATHRILSPARLEVVVEQWNLDGFPSHAWNLSPLGGLGTTIRTVRRGRPFGGSLHTMAMIRCFWLSSSTSAALWRCLPWSAGSSRPFGNDGRPCEWPAE